VGRGISTLTLRLGVNHDLGNRYGEACALGRTKPLATLPCRSVLVARAGGDTLVHALARPLVHHSVPNDTTLRTNERREALKRFGASSSCQHFYLNCPLARVEEGT
jgi:hypothetical protein